MSPASAPDHATPRLSTRAIAARIGVSAATVSRVLNGRPGVAPQTRARVLGAMRDEGLRARGGADRERLVAVVVPDLEDPVHATLAGGVESRLAQHGVTALIGSSAKTGASENDYVDALVDRGADALVLIGGRHTRTRVDTGLLHRLHRDGVPLVLIGGHVPDLPVTTITTDHTAGARMAVNHLLELGHTRIGLAHGEGYLQTSVQQLDGYRSAMRDAFGEVDEDLHVESSSSVSGGRAAGARLFAAGATAVLTGSDLMALGALFAARDAGLWVHTDVSVIGCDDTFLASVCAPPLTTVHQPFEQIATTAALTIAQHVQGLDQPPVHHVLAPKLVVRESTGPCVDRRA